MRIINILQVYEGNYIAPRDTTGVSYPSPHRILISEQE